MSDKPATGTRIVDWLEDRLNLTELFSFLTVFGLFLTELDSRKPVREAVSEGLERPFPSYARWPRVAVILTLILFLLQCVTGILLAFYYRPTSAAAYESVRTIVRDVSFGWFVHQVHIWGSRALVAIALVRLLRLFFDRLYVPPRELQWVLTFLLFILATHADFSGRILTWENGSYWSSMRALELFSALPFVGWFFSVLIGGGDIGDATLTRFYFVHIVLVPGCFFILFFLHSLGLRRVGPVLAQNEILVSGLKGYKRHMLDLGLLLAAVLGILVTAAILLPQPFGPKADPLSTPIGTRPPWYLLPAHGFYHLLPVAIPPLVRGGLILLGLGALCFLPFIDRGQFDGSRRSRRQLVVCALVVLIILILGFYGYRQA